MAAKKTGGGNGTVAAPQPVTMQPAIVGSPPTENASQIAVTVTPVEFLATFGRTRIPVVQDGSVHGAVAEWFVSISMSPITAKHLAEGLNRSIAEYERKTGKIPSPHVRTIERRGGKETVIGAAKKSSRKRKKKA